MGQRIWLIPDRVSPRGVPEHSPAKWHGSDYYGIASYSISLQTNAYDERVQKLEHRIEPGVVPRVVLVTSVPVLPRRRRTVLQHVTVRRISLAGDPVVHRLTGSRRPESCLAHGQPRAKGCNLELVPKGLVLICQCCQTRAGR